MGLLHNLGKIMAAPEVAGQDGVSECASGDSCFFHSQSTLFSIELQHVTNQYTLDVSGKALPCVWSLHMSVRKPR